MNDEVVKRIVKTISAVRDDDRTSCMNAIRWRARQGLRPGQGDNTSEIAYDALAVAAWDPETFEAVSQIYKAQDAKPKVESDQRRVTVCSACSTASCWQGAFMCDKAFIGSDRVMGDAGTKVMTRAELRALALENEHWFSDERLAAVGEPESWDPDATIDSPPQGPEVPVVALRAAINQLLSIDIVLDDEAREIVLGMRDMLRRTGHWPCPIHGGAWSIQDGKLYCHDCGAPAQPTES